jgi:hypothetical protein
MKAGDERTIRWDLSWNFINIEELMEEDVGSYWMNLR